VPVPYVDTRKAEDLFRHRVFRFLKDEGLLSEERIELLLSWKRSGFSVDDSVRLPAGEQKGLEQVARYMLRSPLSLSRMRWTPGNPDVFYASKGSDDDPEDRLPKGESIDAFEFVARVIAQTRESIWSSTQATIRMWLEDFARKAELQGSPEPTSPLQTLQEEPAVSPAKKASLRRRWADLIQRVYEVDPLVCSRCGGQLRVISFITQPTVIRKIVDHLKKRPPKDRAPPKKPVALKQ